VKLKKILVPLDGSDAADAAMNMALNLAEKAGSEIELLNVVRLYVAPLTLSPGASYAWAGNYLDDLRSTNEKMLSEALKRAKAKTPELKISTKMLEGRPASRIVEEAKEGDFNLIVMGSSGLGGISSVVLGSVSSEVAHSSYVPVMITRQKDDKKTGSVDKILIPIDGSEKSQHAQKYGLRLAEIYDAEVDLLHVFSIGVEDVPVFPYPMQPRKDYPVNVIPEWIQPYSSEYKKESEGFLTETLEKARAAKPNLKISKKLTDGRPAEGILKVSEEGDYDMIVLGGSGWGNIGSLILGSVSSKVTNNSMIPVTLVK
jgi:nucleotide-binding universal stress UspA family protein